MVKKMTATVYGKAAHIGVIEDGQTKDLLVFEYDGGQWLPTCRVREDGPNVAFPSCFRPRQELTDALSVALDLGVAVPFDYEVPDA